MTSRLQVAREGGVMNIEKALAQLELGYGNDS